MSALPHIPVSQERPAPRRIEPRAEDRAIASLGGRFEPICQQCAGQLAITKLSKTWLCRGCFDQRQADSLHCLVCRALKATPREEAEARLLALTPPIDARALHLSTVETLVAGAFASLESLHRNRVIDLVWRQGIGQSIEPHEIQDSYGLFRTHLHRLRPKLRPSGWTISYGEQEYFQLRAADQVSLRPPRQVLGSRFATVEDGLAALSDREDGHLLWRGPMKSSGGGGEYPHLSYRGQSIHVRRLLWERIHGPIPPAYVLIPRCERPRCIDPTCGELWLNLPGLRKWGRRER